MSIILIRVTSIISLTVGFILMVSALAHTFYFDSTCSPYPSGRAYAGCVLSRMWLTFATLLIILAAAFGTLLGVSLTLGPSSSLAETLTRDRFYFRQTRSVYLAGNPLSFLTFLFTVLTYAVGPQFYDASYRWGDTFMVIFSCIAYSIGLSFPYFEARQGRGPFEPTPVAPGTSMFTSTDKFARQPQTAYLQEHSVSEAGADTRVVGQPTTYSPR
jgi:hypothetical protein